MSEDEKGTLWIEPRCRPLPITDYGARTSPNRWWCWATIACCR